LITLVEFSASVFSTAREARDNAANSPDPVKILPTFWASIAIRPRQLALFERKIVTTRFIRDSEVETGFSPCDPMRGNSATAGAILREQMRQFVAHGLFDVIESMIDQRGIERDQEAPRVGPPRTSPQTFVPLEANPGAELRISQDGQEIAR
jgi:hypothetical protein